MAEVHLRVLTAEDATWLVEVDAQGGELARRQGWDEPALHEDLAEGVWASDEAFGWAIVSDGAPAGFALVTGLDGEDAEMEVRVAASARGRGIGREVLRQLADHHFASHDIRRLTGRTHEANVPMQRAFNAAGFRMEARYRDTYPLPDGRWASEWGYALTRTDWEAGRHRADDHGYDLHGTSFVVEDVLDGTDRMAGMTFSFLQEGRRALARYRGGPVTEGELAGILTGDLLVYRFVHELDRAEGELVTGGGRARVQRRQDGRLEVVNEWSDETGRHGRTFLVER
ncbi:MAG: GNAT family N-acetyltransferase [Actinomycetes bacterium]